MQRFSNNALSALVAGVDPLATTLLVSSGATFPATTGGDHFLITLVALDQNGNEASWEICKVTFRDGNELTVLRAQEGTIAQSWAAGARVELRLTAGSMVAPDDPRLSDAREWTGTTVTQVEAEAGTATTVRKWTAQRVFQAIAAWWSASAHKTKLDGIQDGAQVNAVTSVASRTGAVTLGIADIANLQSGLDGKAAASHAHSDATTSVAGFMSAADKTKLNGVATGANNYVLPARLGTVAQTITDWNDASETGWYRANSATNAPATGWYIGYVEAHDALWATQTVHAFTSDGSANSHAWRRDKNNGAWSAWHKLQLTQAEQDARYAASSHAHADATTSAAGFMSAADKTKLNGVATGANNYSHPTGDGNLHVPATGTTNNGKVLKAGSTAGSLSWGTLSYTDVGAAAASHTHNYAGSASAGGAAASVAQILTRGTGLTGNNFNGSAATTWAVAYGATAGTACQGNDARLSDSRPASDVYAWAKAASKPTYTAAEVGAAASSHTHSYLPLAGGSLTGAVTSTSTIVVNNTTASTSATTGSLRTTGGLGVGGAVYASGNITAYSDARLKTDVVEISDALVKVRALRGVTYTRIDTGDRQTGVIAQEVQAVLPEAVSGDEYLGVAYGNMVGLLIQAIKEQADQIDQLNTRTLRLENL